MEESKKLSPMNRFQQIVDSKVVNGNPDSVRRVHSARYPRGGELSNQPTLNVKQAWTSTDLKKEGSSVLRSRSARSRTMPEIFELGSGHEIERVRQYNEGPKNTKVNQRRWSARPKTALGLEDRRTKLSHSYPGFSESSHSYHGNHSIVLDPNIPVTSNWIGLKDLDQDKVFDLYKRYLGLDSIPKIPFIMEDESQEQNGEGESSGGISERQLSEQSDSRNKPRDSVSAWLRGVNASKAKRDIEKTEDKVNVKHTETKDDDKEQITPSPEKRMSLDVPMGLRTASRLRKSMSRFRRGSKKPDPTVTCTENGGSNQLDNVNEHQERENALPNLKVSCSVDFEAALKELRVS